MTPTPRHGIAALLVLAALALAPPPARAQQPQELEIKGKPPEERVIRPGILPPPGAREITRPRESDFYPENIRVRFDPAFIPPFTAIRRTGPRSAVQIGLAGWTSPNTPVPPQGPVTSVFREAPGAFALGFAIVWDVNVPPPGEAAPSGAPQ